MLKRGRHRNLSLPALALVIAILGTASLLLITTLRSLDRDRERMSQELQRQGLAIIRTLESGARTGMMMRWGKEQLQALLEEATKLSEITYVAIFDTEGAVIAESSVGITSPPWPDAATLRHLAGRKGPLFRKLDVEGQEIFQVARRFVPTLHQRGRGRMMHRLSLAGTGEWTIVLGLNTGPWEKLLSEGRRQSLLSFLVILTAGSLALYLGIILQNNVVVRRTLAEMKAYAQNIVVNMADGLLSVDLTGKVDTFNPEALRVLERTREDVAGKDLALLVPGIGEDLKEILSGGSGRRETELILGGAAGGERPTGVALSSLRSEEGAVTGAVVILRDLTEVRKLEQKIRDADKLAALGEMAATVAHEIRNPLSSIKGFAQLFREKFDASSAEAGYAALMVREVDRLNRTITDLLFFSRPLPLNRAVVDVRAVVEETYRLLSPDFESKGQRTGIEGAQSLFVEADADQLSRVFLNIILNAHQAAGEGGTIVTTLVAEGGKSQVEVRDSGPGMTAEEEKRAFEPFYTTREKGSGLGLAIVKKIVELHDGAVRVESRPGEETAVIVELPGREAEDG